MEAGKIYKAIADVMKKTDAISKNQKNQQQGFQFRGIDDVMNELHGTLAECGVFIVPEVLEENRTEGVTKTGNKMFYTRQKIKFTFYADDGSHIESVVIGEAMDTGDKASNKALSIGFKYACLQVFCIPTEDEKDPDAQSHEMSAGAKNERDRYFKNKQQSQTAPKKTDSDELPGGPDTPEQTAEINRLLSTVDAKGSKLFGHNDVDNVSAMRKIMPANALIVWLREETKTRKAQRVSDAELAAEVEKDFGADQQESMPIF